MLVFAKQGTMSTLRVVTFAFSIELGNKLLKGGEAEAEKSSGGLAKVLQGPVGWLQPTLVKVNGGGDWRC